MNMTPKIYLIERMSPGLGSSLKSAVVIGIGPVRVKKLFAFCGALNKADVKVTHIGYPTEETKVPDLETFTVVLQSEEMFHG